MIPFATQIADANSRMLRKLGGIYLATLATALASVALRSAGLLQDGAVDPFRTLTPTLARAPWPEAASFVLFFGLATLATPIVCAYLIWRDPIRLRLEHALRSTAGIGLKKLAFVYLVAAPLLLALLYFVVNVPAPLFAADGGTFGARIIREIATRSLLLVVIGPVACIGVWLWVHILVCSVSFLLPSKEK